MQTDMRIYSPQRHPWLAEIESSPTAALDDLVRGYAAIPPYERADAPDAARQLFGSLEPDDAARQALDAPSSIGSSNAAKSRFPPISALVAE